VQEQVGTTAVVRLMQNVTKELLEYIGAATITRSSTVTANGVVFAHVIRAIQRQISRTACLARTSGCPGSTSCCLLLESTTQSPPGGTCVAVKNTPTISIYEEHKYLPDNKFGRL
jgi:hypothetical protein